MRTPQKSRKIYENLRQEILHRDLCPGTMLLKEEKLAAKYGVARNTLRTGLDMLEQEHLIYKVRGRGTFVADSIKKSNITLILPCSGMEKLNRTCTYVHEIFQGVLMGVKECCCSLETIPISPSNDPVDIDWSRLYNLNEDSRVILPGGHWFQPIFDFLKKCNCKVALIYDDDLHDYPGNPLYSSWLWLIKDVRHTVKRMVTELLNRNCRRPLVVMRYLDEAENITAEEIFKISMMLAPEIRFSIFTAFSDANFQEYLFQELNKLPDAAEIDGILVDSVQNYNILRTLYPDVPCGFFNMCQEDREIHCRNTFYSKFSYFDIGRDSVLRLLNDYENNNRLLYEALICTCE